jgi:Na+/H+-dicarboxylate symporter/ABC-type amino acid transport substrate-binding protein
MKIVLGLVLGVLTGVFLGDIAAPFVVAGEIFIGLLQMTVLPYIVVSLVSNLGRISWSESRGLLIAAMTTLVALLLLGVIVLLTVPLAFPDWQSASFFSSSLVQLPAAVDLVALYIPSNPFASLANNLVPASVMFSILLGIGVSGLKGNEGLLRALDVLADALNRINKIVIRLTPVGAFAIAAGVAGTVLLGEINKLQAYLLTYTVVSMILAFMVLPLLVSSLTPFRYRDLLSIPRDTLVTIFATAKIIVVLPQLIEDIRELFRRNGYADDESDAGIRILLPLAYPFPNLGTYAILMFIPFSAWYLGRSLDFSDQLMFQLSAMLSSFVAPIIGIPFLLDAMRLPADMMELFIMSTVYTDRIRVVLGAMHLISLTVIAVSINRGIFRVNLKRLLWTVVSSLAAVMVSLLLLQSYLSYSLGESYQGDRELIEISWMDQPVPSKTYSKSLPPVETVVAGRGRLAAIEQRQTLRVGYLADSLPIAFRNHAGNMVGFDIEMGHHLASDMGVELELVRVKREQISELFASGQIDIVMSGIAMTPGRIRQWTFGYSPLDMTLGFLVEDHRRKEFRSYQAVTKIPDLKLGVVQHDESFIRQSRQRFPNAEFVQIESPRSFLRGKEPALDAVVYSAEGGSAWTLIYPGYTMVVPLPLVSKVPLGYPLPPDDASWLRFVSEWTHLKQKDGTVDALFAHWIGGAGAAPGLPRWSVIRDVLGWVD